MSTCKSCQPMPSCIDGLDRYSLQDDNYLFVLNCPPGYTCEGVGEVGLICCDGTEFSVVLGEGLLAAERANIIHAMMEECARRFAFCDPPVYPYPPGSPSDPTIPDSPGSPDTPTTTPVWYYSHAFSITITCPGGGNTFTYTLPAGRYIAASQDVADAKALAEAKTQTDARMLCLSPLSATVCAGSSVSGSIIVSGPGTMFHWSVVGGAVPTGMTLASGWRSGHTTALAGTPTTPGTYSFTIRCRSVAGDYCDRNYSICVVGMTPDTLPDGTTGTAYSQTLSAPSCATGPLSFQITAGALPDGLFLDEETGVISGTPTADGTYNFTVTLQTEAT